MNRKTVLTMIPCVGAFLASELAGEQLTRDELVRAMVDSVEILFLEPVDAPASPEDVARVRADLDAYAAGLSFVPDVIDALPAGAKREILGRKLTLFCTDPECCRAKFKACLLEAIATANLSKRLPTLAAQERREFRERIDRLASRVTASAANHLGPIFSPEEVDQALRGLAAGLAERVENPICSSMKRLPSEREIDAVADELEARFAQSRDRWVQFARTMLPPVGAEDYQNARTALRDQILAEVLVDLQKRLTALTTPDWVLRLSMDDLAPGYAQAHSVVARLFQERAAAAAARSYAALLARVQDARDSAGRACSQPAAGAASAPGPLSPPPRHRGWQIKIDLPAGRPASQPAAKPNGAPSSATGRRTP